MKTRTQIVTLYDEDGPLQLQNGTKLASVQVAYDTYGRLNAAADNAVLICHALTGDAHAAGVSEIDEKILESIPLYRHKKPEQPGWWDGLIGPGKAIDTDQYFVICSNILGSCYGTTGPLSINPQTGKAYGPDFPRVSVRDMVRVQKRLLDYLGVRRVRTVIGGSLGGMQVLEWGIMFTEMLDSIIPIATSAAHSAWAIGFNHLARQAIINDPEWRDGYYKHQPERGLSLARQIAMISYRAWPSFQQRFAREKRNNHGKELFQVESYLNYQGSKLVNRFDANTLMLLTEAMDSHNVGADRDGVQKALNSVDIPALCIGIDSDILYPAAEQQEIARLLPRASYEEIHSVNGHDAFLIEYDQLNKIVADFLARL